MAILISQNFTQIKMFPESNKFANSRKVPIQNIRKMRNLTDIMSDSRSMKFG